MSHYYVIATGERERVVGSSSGDVVRVFLMRAELTSQEWKQSSRKSNHPWTAPCNCIHGAKMTMNLVNGSILRPCCVAGYIVLTPSPTHTF